MINFVANAFQFLFSVVCLIAFGVLIATFFILLGSPYGVWASVGLSVIVFVGLVVALGLTATFLDIRRCLKKIAEVERQPRLEKHQSRLDPTL